MRPIASLLALVLTIVVIPLAAADADPWIVLFSEEGCPDCTQVEELLAGLILELPKTTLVRYDISDPEALDLLMDLAHAYNIDASTLPVVFVGDEAVVGAGRTQEFALRNAIGTCTMQGCRSPLERTASAIFRVSLLRLTLLAVMFTVLWWWQTSRL
jgi:glutaredoxin